MSRVCTTRPALMTSRSCQPNFFTNIIIIFGAFLARTYTLVLGGDGGCDSAQKSFLPDSKRILRTTSTLTLYKTPCFIIFWLVDVVNYLPTSNLFNFDLLISSIVSYLRDTWFEQNLLFITLTTNQLSTYLFSFDSSSSSLFLSLPSSYFLFHSFLFIFHFLFIIVLSKTSTIL